MMTVLKPKQVQACSLFPLFFAKKRAETPDLWKYIMKFKTKKERVDENTAPEIFGAQQ
jgi:hypothetical protein